MYWEQFYYIAFKAPKKGEGLSSVLQIPFGTVASHNSGITTNYNKRGKVSIGQNLGRKTHTARMFLSIPGEKIFFSNRLHKPS